MEETSNKHRRLAALGLVLLLLGIAALTYAMFTGRFTATVPVTVFSARSGLVMAPDAKVKLRGVDIGLVRAVNEVPGGAELELDIYAGQLEQLPRNVHVEISATTIFGAKYVHFIDPAEPDPSPLPAGATINADAVTVEINTVFENLTDLLRRIEPDKLNATLGAVSTALQGRGDEVGDLITRTHDYLEAMNPSLPQLQNTSAASAEVTNLYADEVGAFLDVVRNTTAVSGTIVDEQTHLDALLLSVIGLGDTANEVIAGSERDITTALSLLRPTTRLLDRYSPAINCIIVGLDNARPIAEDIFGGLQEGIALNSGFMYGAEPYTYPDDLPKVNATGGPNCFGLPNPPPGGIPPYLVTDTANVPFVPNTRLKQDAPRVYQLMFAGIPGVGE